MKFNWHVPFSYNTVTRILDKAHSINGYSLKVERPRETNSDNPAPQLQRLLTNSTIEASVPPGSSGTNLYMHWAPEGNIYLVFLCRYDISISHFKPYSPTVICEIISLTTVNGAFRSCLFGRSFVLCTKVSCS